MKYFFYFLILVFLISCSGNNKPGDNPNLAVKASLLRSYNNKTYDIKLSITNISDKPVSFWMMNGSWFENFIINNDYIQFLITEGIDHNFPVKRHLNPRDSLLFKVSILKIDFTRYQTIKTTKFGFILIDSTKCSNDHEFRDCIGDKSKHKIFWSNPLYLNDRK